jgi:hypothetical protein
VLGICYGMQVRLHRSQKTGTRDEGQGSQASPFTFITLAGQQVFQGHRAPQGPP